VSLSETAESVKISFRLRTRVGPGNHVLDGGADDAPMERGNFERGRGVPL